MRLSRAGRALPLLGVFALAACDAGQATDPMADDVAFGEDDRIALEVIVDPDAVDAALALAEVPVGTAARRGMAWGGPHGAMQGAAEGQAYAEQARLRFQEAVQALGVHDSVQAMERAREARRLVVRAMVAVGGPRAVGAMVDRAGGLAAAVGQEPGMYRNGYGLHGELNGLATRARERLQLRDSTGAGECAVLAEQRYRNRQLDPGLRPGGPEMAVELGATAVVLATRLVSDAGGPDEDQARLLAVAEDYVAAAGETLAAGYYRRVVHLADLGQWTALQAVAWPDGVSIEEAAAIQQLAEQLVADAAATEPTGVAADLLVWAQNLLEWGSAALEEAPPRGTGALWRAAVIGAWILG